MKRNEKKMIFVLVVITLIVCVIYFVSQKKTKEEQTGKEGSTQKEIVETQDGKKENTRDKVKADKQIDGLKITNINVSEQEGITVVTANVENTTKVATPEMPLTIKAKNDKGEVVQEIGAYVGKINAGETRQINASVSLDVSQIHDIEIIK